MAVRVAGIHEFLFNAVTVMPLSVYIHL